MKTRISLAILTLFCVALPAGAQDAPAETEKAESLTIQHYPRYFYNASRTPTFTILFNDQVSVLKAGREFFFEDHDGKAVNARVRQATEEEIGKFWQYYGGGNTVSPDRALFLTVEPSRRLPVGKNWRLVIPEGFQSETKSLEIAKRNTIGAGTIRPFTVQNADAQNPYNSEPLIGVWFSKDIDPSLAQNLDRFIQLSPQPEDFSMKMLQRGVELRGDFKYGQKYDLLVRGGMLGSDGLELEEPYRSQIAFQPREGFITLPDFDIAQPLSGEGTFKILMGNLENIQIRVKELKEDSLIYALRGYAIYDPEKTDWEVGQKYPAFEMVPGKTIYDETIPMTSKMDQSESYELLWSTIVPENTPAGLYISVEGDSRDHPSLSKHRVGASSIVQLTDLGIVWKKTTGQALAYAFSLKTGRPVAGASLDLIDADNHTVSTYLTDQDGVASFPLSGANETTRYLVASNGNDRYATDFDPASDRGLSTWQFDIRQKYSGTPDDRLRAFLFSDRGIYKPGETVHMKAIARMANGEKLQKPNDGASFDAKLTVFDGRGRKVLNREIDFNHRGTLDLSFPLPVESTGTYRAQIDFDELLGKNPEYPDEDHYDRYANLYFTVADYRPNTFEVHTKNQSIYDPESDISIPVAANYYRGKPLSKASLRWHASYYATSFSPDGFEGYVFGERDHNIRGHKAGEASLDDSGSSDILLDFIPTDSLEQPVQVSFGLDVTDINQQTISKESVFLVHSSDYYLGLKLPAGWLEVGGPLSINLLPVTKDGNVLERPIPAKLTIEREIWTTTKIQTASGQIRHKNEWVFQMVSEEAVTVAKDVSHSVTLNEGGTYRFTLESTAEDGPALKTVTKRHIWGDGDVYWAHRDGDAIELVANEESYLVGDTAKIMVRSPILGTALITTERAGVYRTFVRELTTKNQTIDLPITDNDSPNLFVSVLVVRGSQDSPHKFQDTDYKLGYCELKVTQPANALQVSVDTPSQESLPGSMVEIAATVTDWQNQPVRNAEVTLYAVDEGVLSLTGYRTPEPATTFHRPYPLYVKTWHTLFEVLPENPDERTYSNKGLMIGGGGDSLSMLRQNARKDFRATAFWAGALMTDDTGKVRASFRAPENLTEFRVVAVAVGEDLEQYGSGTNKLTINKPLIVEPALPAFANVGDQILIQAVVHNTTESAGRFEVTLKADGHVRMLEKDFQIVPAAFQKPTSPTEWSSVIELGANTTDALPIPIEFVATGETKWTWTIRDINNSDPTRTDSIETKLKIGFPVPLLGEAHHVKIDPRSSGNLLASFGKDLMNGIGDIDITLSNTRMLEALDALDYNLKYPYGCVEQTTSSTLPWMTMNRLEKVFPSLKQDEAAKTKAINYGLNRLLSMQTSAGGLSYWPGENQPMIWGSAWGGLALAMGKNQGYDLPEERLDALWTWLSSQLRSEEKSTNQWYDNDYYRCLGLYTLALAGKPEPSYHEVYYQRRLTMKEDAKALLALAILQGGTAEQRALVPELLSGEQGAPTMKWYGRGVGLSTRLIAHAKFNPSGDEVDQILVELLKNRKPPYGWGSTYANAWPLLALSNVAELEAISPKPATLQLAWGQETPSLSLASQFDSRVTQFGFAGDVRDRDLKFDNPSDQPLFAHISVATRPAELSMQPRDQGFKIRRSYHQLAPDGTMTETNDFEVGDLVVVHLETTISNKDESFLAVDDPLPSVFEAINPAFENRANANAPLNRWKQLPRDFEEIRTDRALFFCNRLWSEGTYRIQYLARVVASGVVTAPPAKIEAMYEPQRHGLSATTRVTARLPGKPNPKVASR